MSGGDSAHEDATGLVLGGRMTGVLVQSRLRRHFLPRSQGAKGWSHLHNSDC